jgi:cytochrome c556
MICAAVLAAAGLASPAWAQDPVPGALPGWTGVTNPQDVIDARRAIMTAVEDLMRPIDGYTADGEGDPTALTASAQKIAAMLLAFPHLFPPTTNLYNPAVESPPTLALPKLWEEFPAFYAMALAASTTATAMAATTGAEPLREASRSLRASCDSCHALSMRPYVRSKVSQEDLDFDFDSVFQKD